MKSFIHAIGALSVVVFAAVCLVRVAEACTIHWPTDPAYGDNGQTVTASPAGIFSWEAVTVVCTATGGSCQASGNVKTFFVKNTPGLNVNIAGSGTGASVSPSEFFDVPVGSHIELDSDCGGLLEDDDANGKHVLSAWDQTELECAATLYKDIYYS